MRRVSAPELHVVTFPNVGELRARVPRLVVGIVILSLGIALILQARLGVSAYDVLHQGLAKVTGLSFGTVVVLLGLVILVGWIPIGQRFGLGTIVNTLTVGFIVDATLRGLPAPNELSLRWPMLLGGIVDHRARHRPLHRRRARTRTSRRAYDRPRREGLAALGGAHGAGAERSRRPGWALGGNVGVGTVLFAFSIGPLAHWFLARLHLGVGSVDPDPSATVGE